MDGRGVPGMADSVWEGTKPLEKPSLVDAIPLRLRPDVPNFFIDSRLRLVLAGTRRGRSLLLWGDFA